MKLFYRLTPVLFLMIFLFSCNNNPDKKNNSSAQQETKSKVESPQNDTGKGNTPVTKEEKKTSSVFELLQGKWQHVDDKTNYLVFEKDHRKETSEGMDKWDDEVFILSDKCMNNTDKAIGIEPEDDRYISCAESDLCWHIAVIDKENLTLTFMGRGNSQSYKRVK